MWWNLTRFQVFITPLTNAFPPIVSQAFLNTVFVNLDQIIAHHELLLAKLFTRQHAQHPFIKSVCDIISECELAEILDTLILKLAVLDESREDYERYIKQYPLALQRHRIELSHNQKYHEFVQSTFLDHRVKKQALESFLSRPLTQLPRLTLFFDRLFKLTEEGHQDRDLLPVLKLTLDDFIKRTETGMTDTENKAKLWSLSGSLDYNDGEIIVNHQFSSG